MPCYVQSITLSGSGTTRQFDSLVMGMKSSNEPGSLLFTRTFITRILVIYINLILSQCYFF